MRSVTYLLLGILIAGCQGNEPSSEVVQAGDSVNALTAADASIREWANGGTDYAGSTEQVTTSSAPVSELLLGLEARLKQAPNDPDGWVLLAQSYAFVGQMQAAQQAADEAVRYGADESVVRERLLAAHVDSAR